MTQPARMEIAMVRAVVYALLTVAVLAVLAFWLATLFGALSY